MITDQQFRSLENKVDRILALLENIPTQTEPSGVEVYQIRTAANLDLAAARAKAAARREGKLKEGN